MNVSQRRLYDKEPEVEFAAKALTGQGQHREHQLQEAEETWRWEDSGYVFTRKDGSALNPSTLTRAFRWIVDHSELPRMYQETL